MDGGVRVPRVPGLAVEFWLCRREGFRVETPAGRLGVVAGLRFGSRLDRRDALAVRAGLFARRLVLVPVAGVAEIVPREGRIVLCSTPPERGRLRGLLSRLPGVRRRRGEEGRGEPAPGGGAASPLQQGPRPGLSGAGQPPGEAATEFAARMLVEARALVARGWCQQEAALDAAGEPVEPASSTACRWSIAGALSLVWENWRSASKPSELVSRGVEMAVLALAAVIGDLDPWNDAPVRTQAEVLAALDRAPRARAGGEVRESTRLLFKRARERGRLARSLERQATRLTEDAQREYEHGRRLFLKACVELGAADEAEGSASAGRAHVPRSPAGGPGIASSVGSKPSPLLEQGTPGKSPELEGGESKMASEPESAAEEPSAEEQAEEEAAEEPAEEGSAAEEAEVEPAAEE